MYESPSTDLVRRASIEELVGHRNRALEMYAAACDMIQQAEIARRRAAPSALGMGGIGSEAADLLRFGLDDEHKQRFNALMRKSIDSEAWGHLLATTGLGDVMDTTQKAKFREQIHKEPPELTVDNAAATLFSLAGRAPAMFEQSILTVFESCRQHFKSHDGFKIGPRVIVTYAVGVSADYGHWSYSTFNKRDMMRDLDRIFHILDSKPPPDQASDCTNAMGAKLVKGLNAGNTFETDYFRFRWFGGGTLHVYFKRDDLRAKANQIIAKHKGAVLPDRKRKTK